MSILDHFPYEKQCRMIVNFIEFIEKAIQVFYEVLELIGLMIAIFIFCFLSACLIAIL